MKIAPLLIAFLFMLASPLTCRAANNCEGFRKAWVHVQTWNDEKRMRDLLADMGGGCTALADEIKARLARSDGHADTPAAPAAAAATIHSFRHAATPAPDAVGDEAAWQLAVSIGTSAAFDAYLNAYPTGRHRAEAETASASARPYRATICNSAGEDILYARIVYVEDVGGYSVSGWFKVENSKCSTFQSETRVAAFYAFTSSRKPITWQREETDGQFDQCVADDVFYIRAVPKCLEKFRAATFNKINFGPDKVGTVTLIPETPSP